MYHYVSDVLDANVTAIDVMAKLVTALDVTADFDDEAFDCVARRYRFRAAEQVLILWGISLSPVKPAFPLCTGGGWGLPVGVTWSGPPWGAFTFR